MFSLRYWYLFTDTGFQHAFHMAWCSCRLTITRWVLLVEQKLCCLSKHLRAPQLFSGGSGYSIFFCVVFCRSLFVLLSFSFVLATCPSSIYGWWSHFWHFQTFLMAYYPTLIIVHVRLKSTSNPQIHVWFLCHSHLYLKSISFFKFSNPWPSPNDVSGVCHNPNQKISRRSENLERRSIWEYP